MNVWEIPGQSNGWLPDSVSSCSISSAPTIEQLLDKLRADDLLDFRLDGIFAFSRPLAPILEGRLGASRIATINDRAHAGIPALQTFAATQTRRWAHLRLGHARSKQIANLLHCVSIGILP